MKTLRNVFVVLVLLTGAYMQAQVSVSVNIGTPPVWIERPVVEARYYYLPEIQTYYDVNTRHYIYVDNGAWVRRAYLPRVYRHYDLYRGQKVVVNNYYGREPYSYYKPYKAKHHKHHGKPHKYHKQHHSNRY